MSKNTEANVILFVFRMLFNIFKGWDGEGQVGKEREKETIHFVHVVFNFCFGLSEGLGLLNPNAATWPRS